MIIWWIGAGLLVTALIIGLVHSGVAIALRLQGKSKEERSVALKTWRQAIAVLACAGLGLAFLGAFTMSDEEQNTLKRLTAPREPAKLIRFQPVAPVYVSLRRSLVGAGNVILIQNTSKTLLENVVVRGEHSPKNLQVDYVIGRLMPEAVVEIGWTKWNWKAELGETLSVSAEGYATGTIQLNQ